MTLGALHQRDLQRRLDYWRRKLQAPGSDRAEAQRECDELIAQLQELDARKAQEGKR